MKEQFPTPLEKQRFHISEESLGQIGLLKEAFLKLKKKEPVLQAVSFWGSRIFNGNNENSDTDALVFYDRQMLEKEVEKTVSHATFNREKEIENALLEKKKNIEEQLSQTLDERHEENRKGRGFHNIFIDSSEEEIKNTLEYFKGKGFERTNSGIPMDEEWGYRILGPFFLSVGNIYPVRKQILEDSENDPNGKIYYDRLISLLQNMERQRNVTSPHKKTLLLPEYEHFPKTIAEGKKYFLNHEKL